MNPAYRVRLHPQCVKDLAGFPRNISDRILTAIEGRLGTAPDRYGERLRKSMHGYWKLRVGDYRVVFEIRRFDVRVFGIMDRKEVYDRIVARLTDPSF